MPRRTILFVMNTETADAPISQLAQRVAEDGDHLLCLLLDAAPALPVYAYGAPPYGAITIPEDWNETVREAQKSQKSRGDAVETLLASKSVSGEVHRVLTPTRDAKHHVARCARVSDEAILADNMRASPDYLREAAAGILFHSPIGFRLNVFANMKHDRMFVAWDSSGAASSAVHAALPHLSDAREVIIGCIDPVMTADRDGQDPGTDVAAWLCRHGCTVTVSQFPSGGRTVAECIQHHAKEAGADTVVMGAYGHARMIQTVLGGTTRSMVEQTELPVFLAH